MTVDYQKVWRTMNDLEQVIAKVVSAREMIDIANECCSANQQERAETMTMAAYEFLGYFIEEFDEKFKDAWQATVGDLRSGDSFQYTATGEKWDLYDEVLKEREYYEPTQAPLTCDKDDQSPECKGAWTSFWEENYYPEEHQQYTEEELNAMCDKAASDEEKEKCREYNLREAEYYTNAKIEANSPYNDGWTKEYYQKIVDDYDGKKSINYQEAIAAGWRMTDDGIWMPPQEAPKKKWVLPVEQVHDDYYVSFPDDLLEAAKLKEGDEVNWIDNGDGSFSIRKVHKV